MAFLVANSIFAQTIDYSNYNASYEIIGSDSAMIKVTVEGVSFNFVKVEGGKMNLGQLGVCELSTFWLMETELTNEVASLFFTNYLDLRHDFIDNSPIINWSNVPSYTNEIIMQCPFVLLEDYSFGPSYRYAQKVYDEYIYVIPRALSNLLTGFDCFIPSAKQWTFAARGGNKSMHYTYSGSNNQDEVAWHKGNSEVESTWHWIGVEPFPHPVKGKMPNELGLYDMSGNVFEFVNDEVIVGIKETDITISNMGVDAWAKVICGGSCHTVNCYSAMIPKSEIYDGQKDAPKITYIGLRLALIPCK